jgi:hypothetical protein
LSNERVVKASRSDWSNQSAMRVTIQKMVETEGNHNPSKDSQNKVYSQPIFFIETPNTYENKA